jgi:hypothetical protein
VKKPFNDDVCQSPLRILKSKQSGDDAKDVQKGTQLKGNLEKFFLGIITPTKL